MPKQLSETSSGSQVEAVPLLSELEQGQVEVAIEMYMELHRWDEVPAPARHWPTIAQP